MNTAMSMTVAGCVAIAFRRAIKSMGGETEAVLSVFAEVVLLALAASLEGRVAEAVSAVPVDGLLAAPVSEDGVAGVSVKGLLGGLEFIPQPVLAFAAL